MLEWTDSQWGLSFREWVDLLRYLSPRSSVWADDKKGNSVVRQTNRSPPLMDNCSSPTDRIGRHDDSRDYELGKGMMRASSPLDRNLMKMLVRGHNWASPMWSIRNNRLKNNISDIKISMMPTREGEGSESNWCRNTDPPRMLNTCNTAIDAVTTFVAMIVTWKPKPCKWFDGRHRMKLIMSSMVAITGTNEHRPRVETVRLLLFERELIRGNTTTDPTSAKNWCPNCMKAYGQWRTMRTVLPSSFMEYNAWSWWQTSNFRNVLLVIILWRVWLWPTALLKVLGWEQEVWQPAQWENE